MLYVFLVHACGVLMTSSRDVTGMMARILGDAIPFYGPTFQANELLMQNHILLIFDIIYTTTALLGYTPY